MIKRRLRLRAVASVAVAAVAIAAAAVPLTLPAAAAAPAKPKSAAEPAGPLGVDAALAHAKRTGKQVEATAAGTSTETLTARPDGRLLLSQSAMPARKRVGDTWKALDPTLVRRADGAITATTTTHDITLSSGGTGPMAHLVSGDRSLTLTAPVALPVPTLAGPTATYANVLPGVDLTATVNAQGGFSHVFVVKDAKAAANPKLATLELATATKGFTLGADSAGNISGQNRAGDAVITAPAPLMWDSSASGTNGPTARSGAASTSAAPGRVARTAAIGVSIAPGKLGLKPDRKLLTDAATVYPVYIDPSFNWSATGPRMSGWASISYQHQSTNYWNNTPDPIGRMQVGNSGEQRSNTLINFPVPYSALKGAEISSAIFKITNTRSWSCTAKRVNVYAPNTVLTKSNATWNYWETQSNTRLAASASFAHGYSGCAAAGVAFDITSQITTDLASNRTAARTLRLVGDNEGSDAQSWKEFLQTSPTLEILYNHKPNKPAGMTTSPRTACAGGSTVGDNPVYLYAPVSDPNGGTLGVSFKLWKTADASQTALASSNPNLLTYSSGSTGVLIVPSATLRAAAGGTITNFSWKVQATDFRSASDWSATCNFTFDPTRTGAPEISQPQGESKIGQEVSFAITPPSTGTQPTSYSYQLNGLPPVTVSAAAGAATVLTTPTRFTNTLAVTSLSAGGNFGETATITFNADPAATTADADLTGDGVADLLTVGARNGLPSGLWLGTGMNSGAVRTTVNDIGARGNGVTGNEDPSDFNGGQVLSGHFFGSGLQDVLVYYTAGTNAGNGTILRGSGDGSVIQPYNNQVSVLGDLLLDGNGNAPLQLANAGDSRATGSTLPDLIGTSGDAANGYYLNYYPVSSAPGLYYYSASTQTPTPTGGVDWNNWTISTAQVNGSTSMFLWNSGTGALHLWTNLAYNQDTEQLTYTPYTLSTNWNRSAALSLRAADVNSDDTPDLWTIGANGLTTAYLVTGLGGTPAIATQQAQGLVTAKHTWALNDGAAGATAATAADTSGGSTLTGTGNAYWHEGDLFSPDLRLNTDATGTGVDANGTGSLVSANSPVLIDTTKSFSVAAWVKPTTAGKIILSEEGTRSARFILWQEQSDNTWRFGMARSDSDAWSYDQAISAPNAQLGVWTHLVATYNATTSTMALYVNNNLAGTAQHAAAAVSWPSTGRFVIGHYRYRGAPSSYYSGQVSNVQHWDRALNPAEATAPGNYAQTLLAPNVRDVTGDGRSDMLIRQSNGDVLLRRGTNLDNTLTFDAGVVVCGKCGGYDSFNIADANNDGKLDLFMRQISTGDMYVYPNTVANGDPVWATRQLVCGKCVNFGTSDLADVNRDGKTDLFIRENSTGDMYAYLGNGPTGGAITWSNRILLCGSCGGYDNVHIEDANNDGKPDLFMRNSGTGDMWVYPNTAASGAPVWGPRVLVCGLCRDFDMSSLGDVNNDGKMDLMVRRRSNGTLNLYTGNGAPGTVTWGSRSFM
ncbi:LamG-like jellyroll fold domain-containing protein [Micromonospora hortensis]|uniref:LamG-like jellyroll fold domain-containing protein n=1 Tax=Micromonospora hortensis TaxID=2911209 RepID=UPI001EE8E1AB|nr:LamG-like jellyroll fold domain-containing protein [Micromonospora hortensis]MCG5451999.1 FG-GAP-like repeat-containing protein [Micromonospora hortensis]